MEESLAIMELAYQRLEQPKLAEDTRRILQQNFPDSPYLTKSWQSEGMPWWRYWK